MLIKVSNKNQITLPKKVMTHFANTEYFEVSEDQGRIVLVPVTVRKTEAIRAKLALLGIDANDIKAAVQWAKK